MGKIYLTKSIMTFDYRSERKCVSQKITNKLFNSHQMRRKYNFFIIPEEWFLQVSPHTPQFLPPEPVLHHNMVFCTFSMHS